MRELNVKHIEDTIYALFMSACCEIGEDVLSLLEKNLQTEESPFGREVLRQLIENDRLAAQRKMPICQDTGMAVIFMDVGQDVHLTGGDVNEAIENGVRRAYRDGCFRASVLSPLTRINTKDNTPAIVHTRIVPGERVTLTAAPKGFGSENMSKLWMLTPSQGVEGVKNAIVETVRLAGGNPCPPVVVGVGIGGTAERAMLMAKHSLTRECGVPSDDPMLADMERELLERINNLGIGPQGLGGRTTALAVHIEQMPTHIAGLPVAVNMQCHAARHKTAVI
ncbi:MAG: fumarate hydratase [Clostridiales bacterium]|nr:fumarate hydratase [Clostridiales bacterium]MDY3762733.1 fumarate hydratase [Candidatus Ventricola sp.]MCI6589272.1 fumarate hydratase [Clostridiales bacterium]MCI7705324.1 fumarate hydratase [Clostridiales bacterium]MDY3832138.1 fumarate hydratase [Candidatus Ventricola sp.]